MAAVPHRSSRDGSLPPFLLFVCGGSDAFVVGIFDLSWVARASPFAVHETASELFRGMGLAVS
jgi:hypothetical protein